MAVGVDLPGLAALPGGALLAVERRDSPVRPGCGLCAIVGAADHDGVVGDPEVVVLDPAVGPGVEDAARTVLLLEGGILRAEVGLRLLLGVQVVEVPEELLEAVHRRKVARPATRSLHIENTGRPLLSIHPARAVAEANCDAGTGARGLNPRDSSARMARLAFPSSSATTRSRWAVVRRRPCKTTATPPTTR